MAAFTAIATGVGLAMSAGSTAMSFAEASRQRDRQGEAEKAAEEAMESARKRLEVNFYEGLSVQKEPYELQRESLLAGGAQALQAAQSGERGVSAAAGRVALAQQAGEAQIRTAMGREMAGLEKTALQEESRLRNALVDLDIGEVSGQQMIAQQARAQEDAATQAGIQGIQDTIGKGMGMVNLYAGSGKGAQAKGGQISAADQSMMNQAFGQTGLSQDQIIMNQAGLGRETNLFSNMNLDIPALGGNPFDQYTNIKR